jgi:hypothetical protein
MKKLYSAIAVFLVPLIVGTLIGIWQISPPRVSADSPYYATFRQVMGNIYRLADSPRYMGSARLAEVRGEIIAEIEGMGLVPIIHQGVFTKADWMESFVPQMLGISLDEWWEMNREDFAERGIFRPEDNFTHPFFLDGASNNFYNILVKLEAENAGHTVMFMAHYDSVMLSPGAGDNMVSVVALLEVLRIQSQNDNLQNNIWFLFTDAEEMPYHGAALGTTRFLADNPHLEIDLIINVDGTGSGAVIVFETSANTYPMLRLFRNSAIKPIGFSIAAQIYELLPMHSDLTAFRRQGFNGFTFSAMEGMDTRDTPGDTFANLSEATVWHYLLTTMAIAGYIADNPLLLQPAADAVFFPFLPGVLVIYRMWLSLLFGILGILGAPAYFILQARKGGLKVSAENIVIGFLAVMTALGLLLFPVGAYLAYFPLIGLTITAMFEAGRVPHYVARAVTNIAIAMLWAPVLYLSWVILIPLL